MMELRFQMIQLGYQGEDDAHSGPAGKTFIRKYNNLEICQLVCFINSFPVRIHYYIIIFQLC